MYTIGILILLAVVVNLDGLTINCQHKVGHFYSLREAYILGDEGLREEKKKEEKRPLGGVPQCLISLRLH